MTEYGRKASHREGESHGERESHEEKASHRGKASHRERESHEGNASHGGITSRRGKIFHRGKSSLRKTAFREIKSSFGRFMAIFGIIAMGVGFFAGLKVTKEAMLATVKEYLDKHGFYDFRLISTLGFEEEDVKSLSEAGDAAAVEGSVSFDIIYRLEDGSQGVVKAYSVTEELNTLKLLSGRMPQSGDECLVDSAMAGEISVGGNIYLSEDNEDEDLEHFSHRAYHVTGVVQSPLYLQYERGNTSLGTGRLDGFVYLPSDGFDVDYYTEIYVRFGEDFDLYSEEYSAFTEEKEVLWENLTERAADRRYQDIRQEADEKLADARRELEEKKAEGEAELADAAKELADAAKELADAEKELADAGKKILDGEQALADAKEELAKGQSTLEEKTQELADARVLLEEKEALLADARRTIADAEALLEDGDAELAEGRAELESRSETVLQARQELEAGIQALEAQALQLSGQKEGLLAAAAAGLLSPEALEAGLAQIAQGEQVIEEQRVALDVAEAELVAGEAQLGDGWAKIQDGERELAAGWAELAQAKEELSDGERAIAEGREELLDGEQAIRDAQKDMEEAEETLAEKEAELLDGKQEYEDGKQKYEDGKQKYAEGKQEYQDGLKEFEEKIGDAEKELAVAEEELLELKEPDTYVLGRETNMGYACFENDSNIIEGIANIFPLFFFLVAALVCITTMNRMVEEQRTQIGVMKALGYGEAAVMSKFMLYSGLAALTGCVTGFCVGTWGFPKVIWFCYGMMYRADPIFYVFDWKLAAISLLVSLFCSIGTTWLSCRVELAEAAAMLMRPKAPKAGKRVFLERIPFVWKRLGFLRKVSIRNIFRYKKRLFMMVVGISGCTALLVTGFGIKDSIADVAFRQFHEIQIYDVGVSFKDSVDDALREKLENLRAFGMEDFTCVMEKNMDFVAQDGVKSIYLVAGTAEETPMFINLHTQDGERIAYPEQGEAVISDKLAKLYNVRAGDTITLRDDEMHSYSAVVSAVYENYIYNYVHISEDTWREWTQEEPERKTAYLNLAEGADSAHGISAELMKLEETANVTVNADTMDRIGNMMASLNIIVVVVICCAAGLAFIVLYNLTNINITERIREIATIKVLGFHKKETAAYVFRENFLLTALGMIAGLFLGRFLHRFVMNEIQVDLMNFDIYIKPLSYCYSAVLTMAFAWFVNKVMGGKLENISMTESLKSVD